MATIKIKPKIQSQLQEKIREINSASTMLAIHNNLAKRCDPYVPFLEGPLSQTVVVTPQYVRYIQPYARYQYYGVEFKHTLDYHPLASAKWDEAMMRDHGLEFNKEVQEILYWRWKQLGGR